jgi:P-type E1-E2 ATPase
MIELSIPGRADIALHHVVLDVNGTLATDGRLIKGVKPRLIALADTIEFHLLTADTHGRQAEIDAALKLVATRVQPGNESVQKTGFVQKLGAENVIAIGNGTNDAGMLQAAVIGIAVLGEEGLSVEAMLAADVVCPSVIDALDMLLIPQRLRATLRR